MAQHKHGLLGIVVLTNSRSPVYASDGERNHKRGASDVAPFREARQRLEHEAFYACRLKFPVLSHVHQLKPLTRAEQLAELLS